MERDAPAPGKRMKQIADLFLLSLSLVFFGLFHQRQISSTWAYPFILILLSLFLASEYLPTGGTESFTEE